MNYRFIIIDRLGVTELTPVGEDITLEYAIAEKNKSGYTQNIPSKLVFTGDAFWHFAKLERSPYKCDYVYITIEEKCTAGSIINWINPFNGRISLINGNWDFDRCRLDIELDEVKPDQCLDDNSDVEFNLLGIPLMTTHSARTLPSTVEFELASYTQNNEESSGCAPIPYWDGPGDPYAQKWVVYEDKLTINGPIHDNLYTCHRETKWVRQVIHINCDDTPPGIGWQFDSTTTGPPCTRKYVRQATLYDCQQDYYPAPGVVSGVPYNDHVVVCKIVGYGDNVTTIDNGILLSDLLPYVVNLFCPGMTVKSDFFQINPDVPSDTNYITGDISKVKNLIWFQKSDVKRPNSTQNAEIANITFEKIVTALVEIYNTEWRVEGGVFKIEHVNFWQKGVGIDLMQTKYADRVKYKNKYKYAVETIPSKETYQFQEAGSGDFTGKPIVYTGGCITKSAKENVTKHVLDYITTDVELCLSNPESESKVVSDDGFVIIATNPDPTSEYYIITEPNIFSFNPQLNNSMAWAQLHRDYHMYKRQLRIGTLNGNDVTFLSVVPKKVGDKITIPICCEDVFNPDDSINGPFGAGTVSKAIKNLKTNTLELELLYADDGDVIPNAAPVAGGINFEMVKNTFYDIDILPHVSDSDPGSTITAVEVVISPISGATAVVIPGFKIRYTPPVGFVGDDAFTYLVRDNFSQESNNGPIYIIITN